MPLCQGCFDSEVAMLGGIGPMELIIIFLIVILLFGGKKIPEIAKGLGKGIRDFKSSLHSSPETEEDAKTLGKPDLKAAQDPLKARDVADSRDPGTPKP